jgi:hypothetical protein
VVVPALRANRGSIDYRYEGLIARNISQPYNSANATPMTRQELREFLCASGFLD